MLNSTLELLMISHCVPSGQVTFKWGQVRTEMSGQVDFNFFPRPAKA